MVGTGVRRDRDRKEPWDGLSFSKARVGKQNMPVRKADSRQPVLSACPGVPIRRRCSSRSSIRCAGVQQSNYYERSVVQVNKRVSLSAPVLKNPVGALQVRTPEFIAVIGEFHSPNRPRMIAHLNKDGVEPALDLSILEEVVADPEHQVLPVLRTTSGRLCWRR